MALVVLPEPALGDDVVDATGTVTFDSGHLSREVVVQVVGDRRAEALATEVFGLRLGGVRGVDGLAVGRLLPAGRQPAVVNVVNAGSTVPLKFSVGGYRGTDLFAAGFPASSAQSCLAGAPSDVLEQVASPGAPGLTYDTGSDRYQLNWKTQKGWAGSCRTLVLKLRDGSTHTAQFRFK